ncbi:hypothetical protein HDV02_003882 [Globomyces sp. JEL0801]|nr:hypothetical protein HDV02_003882 [Globomyces sp. JEL0801]
MLDVIIACYPQARHNISQYVHEVYASAALKIQVLEVPENSGSADALRHLKSNITNDFILLSCDLITDIPPNLLLRAHRSQNRTMTALFYDASMLESSDTKSSKNDDGEIIGIHEKSSTLLLTVSKADLRHDDLEVRTSILSKFPMVRLYSQLRDAHLYIFKKWVINLIAKNTDLVSVKADLIPLLIECQHRKLVYDREGIEEYLNETPSDIFHKARLLSHSGTQNSQGIVCTAFVHKQGFTARANTIGSYCEINKTVVKNLQAPVPTTAEINPKTQIGSDCLVGDGSKIGERCSIKRSVLGNHVQIGKNCKITNSIIMDYACIEDGVKLDSCVICKSGKVSTGSELKDCEVGGKFIVAKDTRAKSEQLVQDMGDE